MLKTTPFLLFDGNCADAMRFYKECFGGELTLTVAADTPMKNQFPPEKHSRLLYAQLVSGAIDISGADWMAAPALEPKTGNTTAIYFTGDSYEELKPVFDKLAAGADQDKRTFMELMAVPFGVYGQLTDQFGVSWVFRGEKGE